MAPHAMKQVLHLVDGIILVLGALVFGELIRVGELLRFEGNGHIFVDVRNALVLHDGSPAEERPHKHDVIVCGGGLPFPHLNHLVVPFLQDNGGKPLDSVGGDSHAVVTLQHIEHTVEDNGSVGGGGVHYIIFRAVGLDIELNHGTLRHAITLHPFTLSRRAAIFLYSSTVSLR